MRRAPKVDRNQTEIIVAIRGRGRDVISLAGMGNGCPDLLVLDEGQVRLIEVKAPGGKLTPMQLELIQRGWPIHVVKTFEDVGRLFPALPEVLSE